MKKLLFAWLLVVSAGTVLGQDVLNNIKKVLPTIDSLYKAYATKNQLPGLVYGILYNGQLIHTGAGGYSNISKKYLADSSSAFHIASMSKSFTAMAILQLRDKGKLKLDDPAYLYIPELKHHKLASADAPAITIRNLLTHSAGFPEDNPWGDRQLAVSDSQMMALVKKGISYSTAPGTGYEYSNLGYALLGHIIKKVTGKYYVDYISQNILRPLGMTHTYYEYSGVPETKLAMGYRLVNGIWLEQPMLHNGAFGAMGGMITTINDFARYVAIFQSAWPPGADLKNYILKKSSLREMQKPWELRGIDNLKPCPMFIGYGYGLRWSKDCEGKIICGHSGGLPGFGTNWSFMQDYGIGVVCFANSTYAPVTPLNTSILETMVKLAELKPRPVAVSAVLEQRKNQLLKILPGWDNAPASGIFAENFFFDYFTDSLKKEAAEIFAVAGKIRGVKSFVAENNLRGYFIMEGEKSDISVYFTLTPEVPALIQEYKINVVRRKI